MKLVGGMGTFLCFAAYLQGFFTNPVKSWKFDGNCHRICVGFGCIKKEPTTAEMCRVSPNNRKCCFKQVRKTRTLSENLAEIDALKEKVKTHLFDDRGWYFNEFCQLGCQLLTCLFQPRPTKQELCQQQQQQAKNGSLNCCQEGKQPEHMPGSPSPLHPSMNSPHENPSAAPATPSETSTTPVPPPAVKNEREILTEAPRPLALTATQGTTVAKRTPPNRSHRVDNEKKIKTVPVPPADLPDAKLVVKREHPPNQFSV